MKDIVCKLLLVIFIAAFSPADLFAEKICLKSALKRGKIKNTTKVIGNDAACPRGSTAIIDTQSSNTADIITGPQGPQGEKGPQGIQGVPGAQGPAGGDQLIVVSKLTGPNSTSPKMESITCPAGYEVLTGNAGLIHEIFTPYDGPVVISYAATTLSPSQDTFVVRAHELDPTSDNWGFFITALCRPK